MGLMAYTGRVRPGGPADVRELAEMVVTKMSVGEFDNNAYLLRCRRTDRQLLVDAAAEPHRLLQLVGSDGLDTVVTTHQHWDHWQGLAEVVAATGATTVAGAADVQGIPVPTDRAVGDGDRVTVGDCTLEVVHIAGHTPGHIVLLYDDPEGTPHLFTGDSLFPGGVGNTEHDQQRFASLIHDVETKLFDRLPDETWFYPGHGDDSTLGSERPHLPEWKARGW
jgi:glyoxylase-like metal-dependent hydrolase (beta-lactamase superfamily II)